MFLVIECDFFIYVFYCSILIQNEKIPEICHPWVLKACSVLRVVNFLQSTWIIFTPIFLLLLIIIMIIYY